LQDLNTREVNKKKIMNTIEVNEEKIEKYRKLGYNEDILPNASDKRDWNTFNYFTLWMGSVHNVPNYVAVGGFLFLGLSPLNIMFALFISSFFVAALMILNGAAGTKYGIPFSILLKASYGERGALLPGFFRGIVAAIMWYGLQTFAGSLALLILIGKLAPSFLKLGGDFTFFGISIPGLIAFTLFWIVNLVIGLGVGSILNKFTAILNPLIYIVFGGMTIWSIKMAGGIMPILNYVPKGASNKPTLFVYLMIISSVLSVWAAPGVSVSDFTRNAKSFKSQAIGQASGLIVSYAIFAFSSVSVLVGSSIYYGTETWNVLDIISKWDSLFAISFAILVLLMTTISTNATGNIVPSGYQLAAMFPKKINYKKGVIIASIISFMIMPWKLMENPSSIYLFLDIIGAIIGPVAGVMISHYFIVIKQKINLDKLYEKGGIPIYPNGINMTAFIVTLIAVAVPLVGKVIKAVSFLSSLSWIVGFIIAFTLYTLLSKKNQHYN